MGQESHQRQIHVWQPTISPFTETGMKDPLQPLGYRKSHEGRSYTDRRYQEGVQSSGVVSTGIHRWCLNLDMMRSRCITFLHALYASTGVTGPNGFRRELFGACTACVKRWHKAAGPCQLSPCLSGYFLACRIRLVLTCLLMPRWMSETGISDFRITTFFHHAVLGHGQEPLKCTL